MVDPFWRKRMVKNEQGRRKKRGFLRFAWGCAGGLEAPLVISRVGTIRV